MSENISEIFLDSDGSVSTITALVRNPHPAIAVIPRDNSRNKVRGWCFTINNPAISHDALEQRLSDHCTYYVFQLEEGESGTRHFQGYLYLKRRNRLSYVKSHFSDRAHWEAAKGNPKQNDTYCSKQGSIDGPWRGGEIPKHCQGKRTDLANLYQGIRKGMSGQEIFEQYPGPAFKYRKGINDAKMLNRPDPVDGGPDVRLYIGTTGLGKTRAAMEEFPDIYTVPIGSGPLWFDGYDGQRSVLIDDFGGNIKLVDLLKILDRYVQRVPIKGSFTWFNPSVIIITTNLHPSTWYQNCGLHERRRDQYMALARRFGVVREYIDRSLLQYRHLMSDTIIYDNVHTIKDFFN